MLSRGQIIELDIHDLARGGAGVGRADDFVVFVPYTAPGDRVTAEIVGVKKNYAEGRLLEVKTPSPERVKPPCAVFGRCGGCEWQHLTYERQWKTKLSGVQHALKRVGIETGKIEELSAIGDDANLNQKVRSTFGFGYRNRIQLRGEGGSLGFFAAGSRELVPIERCEVAREELNSALPRVREEAGRREGAYKVEIEVLPSGQVREIWNAKHAALGFRQINDEQNLKLQDWIILSLTPGRVLLDLFGGAGNLSLGLAASMAEVHCVDVSAPPRPPEGTPPNLTFHRSPVKPWLYRRRSKGLGQDARQKGISVILDPPREGLGADAKEILESLESMGVSEVAAVGCDPDSWARDLSRFVARGWQIQKLATLDIFPQTHHVEALALLSFR